MFFIYNEGLSQGGEYQVSRSELNSTLLPLNSERERLFPAQVAGSSNALALPPSIEEQG